MFNQNDFYGDYNIKSAGDYRDTILRLVEINNESKEFGDKGNKKEYYKFFNHISKFVLNLIELEEKIDEKYFKEKSFDELLIENNELYGELLFNNYEKSYANPKYSVSIFGNGFGQLMSAFYINFLNYINYCFKHKNYKIYEYNKLFIELYDYLKTNEIKYEEIEDFILSIERKSIFRDKDIKLNEENNPKFRFYTDISADCNIADLRYLFRYGRLITENEIKTAQALLNYPQGKIEMFSKTIAKAFMHGFISQNKNRKSRSVVRLQYAIGQERIIKQLLRDFKDCGIDAHIFCVTSTSPNKQFEYDHRFDKALFIDSEYLKMVEDSYDKAAEKNREILNNIAGNAGIIQFGEKTFKPVNKEECLGLSKEQNKMLQNHNIIISQITDKYIVRDEISFCKVGLPCPEISKEYESVLKDIFEINLVESDEYEAIQQIIIDALDKGEYIHVKGRRDNLTDIKVKLHELKDPLKETNFLNCGADLNIPFGEVFTTPVLNGTNGLLHVKEVYLKGFKYENLLLKFEDGFIKEYDCSNYENREDGKKYIKESLIFPYDTLPMSEFAIGTNTFAYVVARKHNIVSKLPILLVEKMGPHFAIGDPCYAWAEENPVYNILANKEVIARENEKTMKRKTNLKDAYTNIHTDITLPYDSIGFISVINKDGNAIEIMKDGRFVLQGTEKLNEPLSEDK